MNRFLILCISMFIASALVQCKKNLPYVNSSRTVEERVEDVLTRMTLEEKIALTHGNSKFTVSGIDRLDIPVWNMSDGPHGVREENKLHVWEPAGWTTDSASYLPTGTALSATWNPVLAYEFGKVLGQEARARDKDVILGPGINLLRTPLCGRNFEYMGEDPHLISRMVVPVVKGIQEQDVAACVKHFALNNQEYERFLVNVKADERTLREMYLPGFKAAVVEGGALTIMSAYNKFSGDYCSESKYLLNDILKSEWGFGGAVISDWDGTHSTVKAALAGLDVEMGTTKKDYNEYYFADPLLRAVKNGQVDEEIVNDKARRVLTVMFKTKMFDGDRSKGSFTTPEHFRVAREVASEAIVLLKNTNSFLPLNKSKPVSIAVIGDNAMRKHGREGGSSGVKAIYETSPFEALKNKIGDNVQLNYAQGYKRTTEFSWTEGIADTFDAGIAKELRSEAVAAAKKSDLTILFAGLNHDFDCEGWDRKDMKLPYEQDKLIKEVSAANPNTVLVIIGGAPVEMPWVKKVPAIVQGWYAGMEAGNAIVDVLFGDINPSGKLPFTFPKNLIDSPAHASGNYPGENQEVKYEEGIFVGYRYYDSNSVKPLFAFGHGLSYSKFEYSGLKIKQSEEDSELSIEISFKLRNTGDRTGAEIVQLYVGDVEAAVPRPLKELKAFDKIFLKENEEAEVSLRLDQKALSFYDIQSSSWKAEPGLFRILIGSSSQDIRLNGEFELTH